VKRTVSAGALLVMLIPVPAVSAGGLLHERDELERLNRQLHGRVIDHTHNHGSDRRIWSSALNQPRDLYVYLPPGFDPSQQYPLILWLHGFAQDEQSFLEYVVKPLDCAMANGRLVPAIVAAPDGSLTGEPCLNKAGSFFINSKAGAFEDFIIQDVWPFLFQNYPIRPEAEAHVIAGVSMGGGGAYNLAIKYRDRFKIVIGIFPPLNTRWVDCHCRYMRNFRPDCWGWRTDFSRRHEVIGRFYGIITIHLKDVIDALYDPHSDILSQVSWENPIEMIDRLCLHEGELSMYVGYGGKDQFNLDAQVESFLYRARERGLTVAVGYEPHGKHDAPTARKLLPGMLDWLAPQLAPFAPPCGVK
jgi:S-formylglutathione hydrolase FrmB